MSKIKCTLSVQIFSPALFYYQSESHCTMLNKNSRVSLANIWATAVKPSIYLQVGPFHPFRLFSYHLKKNPYVHYPLKNIGQNFREAELSQIADTFGRLTLILFHSSYYSTRIFSLLITVTFSIHYIIDYLIIY